MLASVQVLFSAIADYAGLFPPAQLDLPTVIANYAEYQASPHAWMLGRLILPIVRLDEFCDLLPHIAACAPLAPQFWGEQEPKFPSSGRFRGLGEFTNVVHSSENSGKSVLPWPLSLIISGDVAAGLERVRRFQHGAIAIEALEFPFLSPEQIAELDLPTGVEAFFEVPVGADLDLYIPVLQAKQAAAKVRMGGVTAAAFPSAAQVCQFISTCAQAQLPFKATAGLHHLFPGTYHLTYEPDSARAQMHGFLDVALVAAFLYTDKITLAEAIALLQEDSSGRFQFTDQGVYWNQRSLDLDELTKSRQQFFRSFGSCSFTEPIADLKAVEF
jgi:hypothetical protein